MKRIIKYTLLFIAFVWLSISTFFSFLFLREGYYEITYKDRISELERLNFSLSNNFLDDNSTPTFLKTNFTDRIQPLINESIIKYLNLEYGKEKIDKTSLSSDQYRILFQFDSIYTHWPSFIKKFCDSHVAGVYLTENLQSNGLCISLNKDKMFLIFLNIDVLNRSPNKWAKDDEESYFKYQDKTEQLIISVDTNNNPVYTFENILIHEIGHGIGSYLKITPSFNPLYSYDSIFPFYYTTYDFAPSSMKRSFPFWNRYDRIFDKSIKKISFSEYSNLIKMLDETSYPTLYSSKNEFELFAECFYSYFHCVIQKKPYSYILINKNGNKYVFNNGILEERCEYLRSQISKLFNETSNIVPNMRLKTKP